jgi:hypothetical protein
MLAYKPPTSVARILSSYWFWFCALFLIAVIINFVPLAITWKAYNTDGFECIGFPLTFFARGGNSWREEFYSDQLVLDLAGAIVFSYIFADIIFRWRKRLATEAKSNATENR